MWGVSRWGVAEGAADSNHAASQVSDEGRERRVLRHYVVAQSTEALHASVAGWKTRHGLAISASQNISISF